MINFFNMFTKFVAVLLAVVVLTRADLDVYFDDITITEIDPEYVTDADAWVSDDSQMNGAIVVNFTITKPLPDNTEGRLALLGASMGEYVVPSGVDFRMSMCEMMDEPLLVAPFLETLGFKRTECPPLPRAYGTSGFVLPTENLPTDFAKNKYKAFFEILSGDKIIIQVQMLVEVQ